MCLYFLIKSLATKCLSIATQKRSMRGKIKKCRQEYSKKTDIGRGMQRFLALLVFDSFFVHACLLLVVPNIEFDDLWVLDQRTSMTNKFGHQTY